MSKAVLLQFEGAFLANLVILRDVYVALVQRESVVPLPVQEELWTGFPQLLEAQQKWCSVLKECGDDWQGAYRQKVELLEQPLSVYCGNISRAVGRLLELVHNNQWKIYMESAEIDPKVKGHDMHHFLVEPRAHLRLLAKLLGAMEDGGAVAKQMELMELRVRAAAGKLYDPKTHAVGMLKLKGQNGDVGEKLGRRLLREGKWSMSEDGKKGKESYYWLFDDVLVWGAKSGGKAQGFLKLLQTRVAKSVDGVELTDGSLAKPLLICLGDDSSKHMWEQELLDLTLWGVELGRIKQREEKERFLKAAKEMEERKQREAEAARLAAEQKRIAEEQRAEAARLAAEQKRVADEQRAKEQEAARVVAEQKAKERAEAEQAEAEMTRAAAAVRAEIARAASASAARAREEEIQQRERSIVIAPRSERPPPPSLPSPAAVPVHSPSADRRSPPPNVQAVPTPLRDSSSSMPQLSPQSPRPQPAPRPQPSPRRTSSSNPPPTPGGGAGGGLDGSSPQVGRVLSPPVTIPRTGTPTALERSGGTPTVQNRPALGSKESSASNLPQLPPDVTSAGRPSLQNHGDVSAAVSDASSTAVTGPRVPLKRELVPPPWEKKK